MRLAPCFLLAVVLCLTGCVTPRQPAASGPVPAADITVSDIFEADLRQLLAAGARKDEVVLKLGNPDMHRVPNAAYLRTFLPWTYEHHDNIPPADRARWKREYLASAQVYYASAEDGNEILLFFDRQGRLRWYDHL